MPLWILGDEKERQQLEEYVRKTVKSAETVTQLLTRSVRKVLYDPSSGKKTSQQRRQVVQSALGAIADRFYRETEPAFYSALADSVELIQASPDAVDPTLQAREYWMTVMTKAALRLFDEYAPADGLEDRNIRRHIKARSSLTFALKGYGKEGQSLFDGDLGIVSPETVQSRRRKKEGS